MSKINVEHIKVLDIDLMTNTKVTVSGDSMILTPLPSDESDYERGMRESMQKIAKSCGKIFAVDVGYEQLPDLVDSLVNPKSKPRTHTEYEKVTESASHVIDEFENGGEFYYMAPSLTKPALANRDGVFNKLRDGDALYRKVEKEIDERQEFIERAKDLIDASKEADYSLGNMYDAGCRFVRANGEIG